MRLFFWRLLRWALTVVLSLSLAGTAAHIGALCYEHGISKRMSSVLDEVIVEHARLKEPMKSLALRGTPSDREGLRNELAQLRTACKKETAAKNRDRLQRQLSQLSARVKAADEDCGRLREQMAEFSALVQSADYKLLKMRTAVAWWLGWHPPVRDGLLRDLGEARQDVERGKKITDECWQILTGEGGGENVVAQQP